IDHASGALRQLPFAGKPIGIDASPDGREVWISNLEKNTIAILDPKTDQILETISSEGNGPVRLKFSPDGKRVVVTQSHNDQAVVFDAASRKLLRTIPLGKFPKGLLVSADSRFAFVSEMEDGAVAQVDLQSGKVIRRVK